MTFIAKPKVAHPSLPKNALGLTRRDYEGALSTLCAGCGHDSITAAIVEASWGIDLEPQNLEKLSGIGCSSKTTAYFVSGGHGFKLMLLLDLVLVLDRVEPASRWKLKYAFA